KAVGAAFSPNSLPPELYDALWRHSNGLPDQLALKVKDLIANDLLVETSEGHWRLAGDPAQSPGFADMFSADFYDRIEKSITDLPNEKAVMIRKFLGLIALCGRQAPVDLILDFMNLREEEADELIDVIDERLVESEPAWVIDHEYNHPSFPGRPVYGFATPVLNRIILKRVSPLERRAMARDLQEFFQKALPPYNRGAAGIHLELLR
ncbi:MAG: hypothetical protein GY859_07905, partial [Desulfobacterales bacterium]|nr:hypothetical protein [Desulfobacterales bacterium]